MFPALLDVAISPEPIAPILLRTQCLGDNTLVDLVEGRLAFGDERAVEVHLDTCPACREFLADLVRASGTEMSPRCTVLPPGTRVGRYVLAERLGMGGMGLVYAAEDPELSRRVAIKVVRGGGDPGRLREEARAMARLQSPHAVAVYDVGDLGGQLFVAMELVHGETLRTWSVGRPWREVVEAFRCAGRGLAAAHAAGLVHGDFKPDNVLIRARDRQVLVADFGLAHSGDGGPGSGTPAYMAPEQHAGRRGDARADQFAFCVSLWEALFGQRPFIGRTAAALSEAVQAGAVIAPPRGRAPRWVRRLLERGLRKEPEARHPSMEVLVAALGRDPRRTVVRVGAGVLSLLLSIGAATALMKRDAPCRPTGRELAGVWDGERRAAVRRSLLATGTPFSATTADAVERSLDAWAARWLAARVESCAATRLRGEQSLELLDRRMRCLDDRRAELGALSSGLSRADGEIARRALAAAEELGDVARCEPRAIGEQRPAARRAEAEAAAARLRTAAAQAAAGCWATALPEAQAVTAIARELADRALLAEAALFLGRARSKAGDAAGAAQALDESAATAVAERMDLVAAEAWTELVFVLGHRAADRERAETAGRYAAAAIERGGGDPRLRARLERQLGVAAAIAGQPRQAEQRFREAIRVRESGGGEALELAGLHNDLGAALHTQGRLPEALAEHRLALAVAERLLGPAHPRLTPTLVNLGNVLNDLNRPGEAEPLYRRALSLEERNGQGESVTAASVMANLALCLSGDAGKVEAEGLLRRALSINERRLGPNNAQVSAVAVNLASQLQARGQHAEAEALFERALSIDEQRLGSEHAALAPALNGLARALIAKGRPRDALPLFERALRVRQAELGPEDQRLAYSYEGMGEAQLALGNRRKAVVMLERALGLLERGGGDPAAIAETRSRLQRARTR